MKKNTSGTGPSLTKKKRVEREVEAGAAGALAGATLGAIAGPPGAIAGAVVGAIAGAVAGVALQEGYDGQAAADRKAPEEGPIQPPRVEPP